MTTPQSPLRPEHGREQLITAIFRATGSLPHLESTLSRRQAEKILDALTPMITDNVLRGITLALNDVVEKFPEARVLVHELVPYAEAHAIDTVTKADRR